MVYRSVFITTLIMASQTVSAGTIYTDKISFLAALNDPLAAMENFESFPNGPASNPLSIMEGTAFIFGNLPAIEPIPGFGGSASSNTYIDFNLNGNPIIIDVGATYSDIAAIGFNYGSDVTGQWQFSHSGGGELSGPIPSGPPEADRFIGWVGSGSEFLLSAEYLHDLPGFGAVFIDNIEIFAPVPVPAAVWLFGSGLLGLIGLARRKA